MKSKTGLLYSKRIKTLRKWIHERGCEAIIVEDPTNIYYFTGIKVSKGILVVKPRAVRFFVDGRYFESCQESSPFPVAKYATVYNYISGIDEMGIDADRTSVSEFKAWRKKGSVKPISLTGIRMIKDESEIAAMKKSVAILKRGFSHLRKKLKVGMTEREAVWELEMFCRKAGASSFSFDPIIAFGKNGSCPHYHPGNVKLKKNDMVLIDAGVMWNEYASDRTRCFSVGKTSAKYAEILEVCRRAHDAAVEVCAAGVNVATLNRAANEVLKKAGYFEKYVHSLGHGIGLEIHEPPFLGADKIQSLVLRENMVMTIEPGIYIEGFGGVRYENMIVVKKNGCEIL